MKIKTEHGLELMMFNEGTDGKFPLVIKGEIYLRINCHTPYKEKNEK